MTQTREQQEQNTQQSADLQVQELNEKELTLEELSSVTGGLAAVLIETAKGNKAVLD